MDNIEFQERKLTGNRAARLLNDGIVPAVVYNSKGESHNIQVTNSEATQIYGMASSTTVLDAKLGSTGMKVLVKEIDVNPITDKVRHISFFQIDEKEDMIFTVPFNLVGVAPAVKNNIGVLVKALQEIDVKGKVDALVPAIDIDITGLEHPGQTIYLTDIALPEGLELPNDEQANAAIVTITHPQKEEELEPEPTDEELEEGEEAAEGEEGEQAEGEETPEGEGEKEKEESTQE